MAAILPAYEAAFGVAFSLPKLDLVAIPDFAAVSGGWVSFRGGMGGRGQPVSFCAWRWVRLCVGGGHAGRWLRCQLACQPPQCMCMGCGLQGAMENWGLITYRETALLASPSSSVGDLRYIVKVVAHEMAHQVGWGPAGCACLVGDRCVVPGRIGCFLSWNLCSAR